MLSYKLRNLRIIAILDSSDCRISNVIKATNWGRLWNQLLKSMPCSYWRKLFYTFVETVYQWSEAVVPQFAGFQPWKSYKVRNLYYNLRSEEVYYFYSNSSDCRIYFLWKPTKWGISLINSKLRMLNLPFILKSDSSDCSIFFAWRTCKVRNILWYPTIWGISAI